MDFEALKRLDASKDTVKKIDKYIQKLAVDSNEYYMAVCYKASILHSLKNDDEALKILLPLERKLWMLKNEEVITLCDILKDIYYELNDSQNALKYIKIKEEHLLLIDHDKYIRDMIEYYRFVGDILNEKRQILIYLEENINENDLLEIYERLIEFSFNENNKADFDKYYQKVKDFYLKTHNDEKLAKIDYYKCQFLLENNIIDAYSFAVKKLEENLTDNEKTYYANICIKYFMAQNELRKASIVDSNFQEIALRAQKKFRISYLETTLELYKRLNNNYSIELIEEELQKTNNEEEAPLNEKKPASKQIQKKLDIISQFEENSKKDEVEASKSEKKEAQKEGEKESVLAKAELKPHIDVTLNTYASGYYKILNASILALNEISKSQREPIRKALIEINKQVKFAEAQIIYKKQEGLLGYQFKDGRLYDKSFKNEASIKDSMLYKSYHGFDEYFSTEADFDIITLKESIYSLKIVFPFLGSRPLGAIAFFFREELQNIDYELLKTFAYILSEFIKRQIDHDDITLDERLKNFYLSNQSTGYIKMLDNVMYLNDVATRILNININIIRLDEFYDLISSSSRAEFKGVIEALASGEVKNKSLIYSLNDKRLMESYINVYELKSSLIAVISIEDITKRANEENELIKASFSDSLVNIKSVKALENDLAELYKTKKFSIMLMDAKDFKKYNDVYGLRFHNDLIKAIGLKLDGMRNDFKASIYHYDSDKFIIIIPNNDERNTIKIFGKMLDRLSNELFLLNDRVKLYFNGAILRILLKSPKYSLDKIFDMLTNTLIGLKASDELKNNLAYYDSELANKAFYDFQMELHISEAIDKGLIRVSYNQIADFSTKGIFAYFARLQLINIKADEAYFEEIIQKRGLENLVDRYIVSHALMELNSFKEKIGGVFNLAIPIHSKSLNTDFINFYYDKLRFFKINPKNIYLYIDRMKDNLDLKYVKLICSSVEDAIKYQASFYMTKYNELPGFELKQLKDFLKMLNVNTIVSNVSSHAELDLLRGNEIDFITGKALKGNYSIDDLILLNKND